MIAIFPSSAFTYTKADRKFVAEVSDLASFATPETDDIFGVGFRIKSARTGNMIRFEYARAVAQGLGEDTEITAWEFTTAPEDLDRAGDLTVVLFND